MTSDDVNELIYLPYEENGFGPDSFNCWGLLSYVQLRYFNTKLPTAPIGDSGACLALFRDGLHNGAWLPLDKPVHGCGVLLREGNEPHVGVYLHLDGGGVIHAVRNVGVTWTPLSQMFRDGYRSAKYYEISNA